MANQAVVNQHQFNGEYAAIVVGLSNQTIIDEDTGVISPKLNKNGDTARYMTCIAGTFPSHHFLDGTIAKTAGLSVGGTYIVSVTEVEPSTDDETGKSYRQFTYTKLMAVVEMETKDANGKVVVEGTSLLKGLSNIKAVKTEFGDVKIIEIPKADTNEDIHTGENPEDVFNEETSTSKKK